MMLLEILDVLWDGFMLLMLINTLRFHRQLGRHYLGQYGNKIEEVRVLFVLFFLTAGVGVFAIVVIPIRFLGYLVVLGFLLLAVTLGVKLTMCITSKRYLPYALKNIAHPARYYII